MELAHDAALPHDHVARSTAVTAAISRLRAVPAIGVIVLFFVYPLVRFLAAPLFQPHGAIGDWRALFDSVMISLATAVIAAPLGAAFALFLARSDGMIARAAIVTLWALFLAPSYILTTGWMIVFRNGALRHSLAGQAFFGVGGLLMLYVIKALPFSALVSRAALAAADAGPAEAALLHAVPALARLRVTIRLLTPAIAIGFAIAVIETMQEFGIPATLGITSRIPLLTYAIYQKLAETPTDFTGAAVLCWSLIAVAAVFGGLSLALRREGAAMRHGRARPMSRCRPRRRTAIIFGLLTVLIGLIGVFVPVAALAGRAMQPLSLPLPHPGAVLRSLGFGMVAATMALVVAVMVLRLRASGARRAAALLDAALIGNMAVPGLVLGAGYILAFNNDVFPLYGTRLLLLVGYAAGMVPLALRMMQGALDDLDTTLVDAARLHGLPRAKRLIDIEAALLIQPLTYAYLLVAAAIMFELPVSELLYPPGATPLGVAIVTLDQKSAFTASAELALLGLGAMAAFACVLVLVTKVLAAPRRVRPA